MDELITLVTQKTGISAEQAKQAIETVLEFAKSKLPAPLAAQLDGLLKSDNPAQGLGDIAKGLGGLFGGR